MPETTPANPTPLAGTLAEEYRCLGKQFQKPPETDDPLAAMYRQLHADPKGLTALSISGGGIRSATFAWGVLTALAARGYLKQFDYLSTVSGGGYIGGWLSAWIHRDGGVEAVSDCLANGTCAAQEQSEAAPVRQLRDFSNYLTPRMGLGSADTWTLVSIVVRNLLLNWLVILPLLLLVVVLPRVLVAILQIAPPFTPHPVSWFVFAQDGVLILSGLMFSWATYHTIKFLPTVGRVPNTPRQFMWHCLMPMFGSGILALIAFWWVFDDLAQVPTLIQFSVAGLFLSAISCAFLLATAWLRRKSRMVRSKEIQDLGVSILIWGMASGAAAYAATHWLFEIAVPFTEIQDHPVDPCFYAAFGPPLLVIGMLLGIVVLTGCTSRSLLEEDREWLARYGAYALSLSVGWIFVCTLVLILPHYLPEASNWVHTSVAGAGGICGLITAIAGNSRHSSAVNAADEKANKKGIFVSLLYKSALPLFLVSLFVCLALLMNWVLVTSTLMQGDWYHHHHIVAHTPLTVVLGTVAALLALSWFLGRFININKFSLHAMYENRLVRAYLAASVKDRQPHPFTGFSPQDDLHISALRGQRPLHVVNLALNLVSGKRLAWQQRKAASFTATPYACGNPALGYRDSAAYAGGMTLGNAVTISGAAASPNMGYHSSSLVGFTMMLFNARLGSWLGNPGTPGNTTWKDSGPRSAVASMVREALGKTDDEGPYVYLSDGGHFENLALYEMVRRRCRTIVVLDSGCDPHYTYEDLGNALRKIRIDLNVRIEFEDDHLLPLLGKQKRCAVGRIIYADADRGAPEGKVLYIKPLVTGTEPPDVLSYHCASPDFPHETTGDQWFSEAQTESYRKLGIYTVERMCGAFQGGTLEELIEHVETEYLAPVPK